MFRFRKILLLLVIVFMVLMSAGCGAKEKVNEQSKTAPVQEPSTTTTVQEPSKVTPAQEPSKTTVIQEPSKVTPVQEPSTTTPIQEPPKVTPAQSGPSWINAYLYRDRLTSLAFQVIRAQERIANPSSTEEKKLFSNLLIGYKQRYTETAALYNAEIEKAATNGWVRPSNLPEVAATLDQRISEIKTKQ
jgi:hypothetical protein